MSIHVKILKIGGVECSLMPDIALGQSAQPVESENITIIPAELDDAKQDCLVAGVKLFYGETKRAVKIAIYALV